jgi:CRP-like cAMP-binding protein
METLPRHSFTRRQFRAQERIFEQGDAGEHAFVVDGGLVEIAQVCGGRSRVLGRIGPGGIFGEMALIDDAPRMARATAVENTVCLLIARDRFRAKIDAADPLIQALLRIFVQNIRSLTRET